MTAMRRPLSALLFALSLLGCAHAPEPAPVNSGVAVTAEAVQALPTTVEEALAQKQSGRVFTDCDVRRHYNHLVSAIPGAVAHLEQEGKPLADRARAAYDVRHNARLTCRAMMSSSDEVNQLRARDQEKYGNPDGPTFEQLVEKGRQKGQAEDAIYGEIIASSQRTDEAENSACGIKK